MVVQDKLYTAEDLWELSTQVDFADKHLELIEGELIEVTPSSLIPAMITAQLTILIGTHVSANKLGILSSAEGGFELSRKNVLAPDLGFIAKGRVAELPERYFKGAPDLAVEVVSPTDDIKETQRKAAKFIAYGTRVVWIFYPKHKTVDVCRPSKDGDMSIQEIGIDGMLDGGDVLPGYTLAVRDVFKVLEDENR